MATLFTRDWFDWLRQQPRSWRVPFVQGCIDYRQRERHGDAEQARITDKVIEQYQALLSEP